MDDDKIPAFVDDLQARRLESEMDGLKERMQAVSAASAAGGPLNEVSRVLVSLGMPRSEMDRCTLPFNIFGVAVGQIWDLGGTESGARDCLGIVSDMTADEPYWTPSDPDAPMSDRIVLFEQVARFLRVGFMEIWEILLEGCETLAAEGTEHVESAETVEVARLKAIEICHFLIHITMKAMPQRCECATPSPESTPTPA